MPINWHAFRISDLQHGATPFAVLCNYFINLYKSPTLTSSEEWTPHTCQTESLQTHWHPHSKTHGWTQTDQALLQTSAHTHTQDEMTLSRSLHVCGWKGPTSPRPAPPATATPPATHTSPLWRGTKTTSTMHLIKKLNKSE